MTPGHKNKTEPSELERFGRVAIVHDYLSQFGGAERVALVLSDIFDAPIFTSFYDPEGTFDEFAGKEIHTTYLQGKLSPKHFRFYAPLYGRAMRSLDLSGYDTVIVSTSGFAHQIKHPNAYVYCHTPPRFIYDLDHYLSNAIERIAVKPLLGSMRRSDKAAAAGHVHYAANATKTARLIKELYDKDAPVIHPPLSTSHLPSEVSDLPTEKRALMVTRLQPYKRVDIAIKACEIAGVPLTVVGTGLHEQALTSMAGPTVDFRGRIGDEHLSELFNSHSVVLVPGVEDFGLGLIEANYAGRPVIAQAGGGALETVTDGVNGHLVDSEDPEVWATVIKQTLAESWSPSDLRAGTKEFQVDQFASNLFSWLKNPDIDL